MSLQDMSRNPLADRYPDGRTDIVRKPLAGLDFQNLLIVGQHQGNNFDIEGRLDGSDNPVQKLLEIFFAAGCLTDHLEQNQLIQ